MSRVAVVTGGGTGLGKAIAAALIADGTRVVITGRRQGVLAEACLDLGPAASPVAFDITDPAAIANALDELPESIDVLVHSAGGSPDGYAPTATMPDLTTIRESWLANIEVNLIGAVLVSEALKPRLATDARIIMMGSVAARHGGDGYGAAKAGLQCYTNQLALELGRKGITVNLVAPGITDGFGIHNERFDRSIAWFERNSANGRVSRSDEVAATVAFLASRAVGAITGQVIQVDGGLIRGA